MTTLVDSIVHTWPPFVLVIGLLLIGHAAAREGLFVWIGRQCARVPGPDLVVFIVVMVVTAFVTATLNLDTAVVFMTPVAIETARRRESDVVVFAYASAMMVNVASTPLLGSNLTNLLVAGPEGITGSALSRAMALPWGASVLLTVALTGAWRVRQLTRRSPRSLDEAAPLRVGLGVVATVGALAAVVLLAQPALVVLALGLIVEIVDSWGRGRMQWREIVGVVNPALLAPLFTLAVMVGWLGRVWSTPAHWLDHASVVQTVAATSLGSVVLNNLPAASLVAGHHVAHPLAAILGLDLGPNLFVTGALSSLLWWRIARANGVNVSLARFSLLGVITGVSTLVLATSLLGR